MNQRDRDRTRRRVAWCSAPVWLLGLILLLAAVAPLAAQESAGRVTLTGVDDQAFPQVSLFLDVYTAAGTPVLDLTPTGFTLAEDGQPATIQAVTPDSSQPLALLLALDRSTDAVTWAAVQTAAQAMIEGLGDQDQVSLITVYDQVDVVQPFTADKAAAIASLTAVTPGGDFSAINPALVQAVQQFNDTLPLRRAVVLVADAPDNISTLTADDAVAQISGAGVPVSVVGFGPRVQNEPTFAQFAAATGGRSSAVAGAETLQTALTSLLTDLQQGYRIDFVSGLAADNATHAAQIQVNGRNVTGSATAAFTARGGAVAVTLPGLSAGQPVAGVVALAVEASAPAAIASVEFRVDDQLIGTAGGPGEAVSWDTTSVAPGRHTVRAVVTDSAGNTGEVSVAVVVTAGSTRMDLLTVDGSGFPRVAAYVDVYGPNGLPLAGLDGRSFSLSEDARAIDGAQVTAQVDASQPLQLVLVLDRSVVASEWNQVRNAANTLTDKLRDQDQAAIYAFAGGVALVQPPTRDRAALRSALASLEPVPPAATPVADNALHQAMLDAVNLAASLPGRHSVILLTNGLDNTGMITVDQVIEGLQAQPVPVHILGFGVDGATAGALGGLAQLTGGNSVTVGGAGELRGPAQTLLQLIQQGYRLEYMSPLPADDQSHALTVSLAAAGLQAETNGTFIAARRPVTVTIVGVTDGDTIGGQVDLGAQADAPAPIVAVEYRLNGATLAQTQEIGALVRWNSETVTPGAYALEVIATDAAGNQGSATVNFTVVAPVTVAASLDARNSDGDIVVGDDVTVRAEVTVLEGRATVEFFVGNVLVATDDRAPYEARFDSGEFAAGSQTVTVVARDAAGRQAVTSLELVLVAPPTPTPAATAAPTGFRAAIPDVRGINWGRWLGIAGLVAVLLGLWAVVASALGGARKAAETKTLTPMRLALSNLGNVATGYLLRGDDPAGALFFRFSLNGQTLGQPPVARTMPDEAASVAAGGGRRVGTGLPGVTLPAGASGLSMPKNMGEIGDKLGEVSQFGQVIASILMSVTFFLPSGLARPVRQVVMQIRKGQMLTRRVEYVRKQVGKLNQTQTGAAVTQAAGEAVDELGEFATADSTREAVAAGGRTAGAAVATAAGSAAAGAGRAANKLYDLTGATARRVGDQAAALVGGGNGAGGAGRQWVYVPPLNPGDTVTIDVLVGAAGKLTGSQHLPFRLLSRATGEENAQPVIEAGTVRVTGGSPWRGLMAWIVIGLSVLVAAVLVWWLIGVIF